MKKIKTITLFLLICETLSAQAPLEFSYQAVIRDAAENLVASQIVGIKISILQGAAAVFEETHSITTTQFGVASLEIGSGSLVSGSLAAIDWTTGTYSIRTETDPAGGTSYSITGSTQLISVPYVLYANSSESFISADYNDLTNTPPPLDGSETKLTAGPDVTITGAGTIASPYNVSASTGAGNYTRYIGELYQGGIVVAVWKESGVEKGIIASLVNLGSVPWSNITNTLVGAGAQSIRDGLGNTNAIIAQPGHLTSAAKLCFDYTNVNTGTGVYSDWYLPAIWELEQCYNAAMIVNNVVGDANGFPATFHYSSTENASNLAWGFQYINGYSMNTGVKANPSAVRAIRRF